MKMLIILLTLLFSLTGCAENTVSTDNSYNDLSQGAEMQMTTDEKAIIEAYDRFEQAMIDKDIDTLNALVTPDKKFTHMSGNVQTKEEFFGEIEDGTLNYYSYKLNSPVVTVDGDTALLTGSTTLEAKVYGASGTWTLKTKQHFVRQGGKWLLTDK